MKTGKRFLAGIFCLLMVVLCVVALSSCDDECDHKWSDWKATSGTSCTEPTEKQRTCSLCDAVEKKTFDAEGHKWVNATCEAPKTCSVCKATEGDALGHSWVDATCETAKTCSTCKKTDGEALGHSWKDATCEAPKTCETCKKTEGDALGHTWVGATCDAPKTCSVCKKTEGDARGHNYTYVSNGDGTHTKTCANDASHTATENCSGGTATCTDKAVCDYCKTGYGDEPTHNWGTGTPVSGAGCLTGGVVRYTCSACKETKDETILPEGHSYVDTVTGPTCTAKGYTTHVCSKCSDTYVDTYVDANGHSWDREKDCDHGRECSACGTKEDALGHTYGELTDKATDATCEAAATKTYKCGRCGHEYTEDIGAPKGHNIVGVDPTESLKEGSTCEYIKYYKCLDCSKDVEGEHIHRHKYVASITKAATCKEDGEKTLKCTLCNDTKTEKIEKNDTAHNYVQGTVADGKRTDTCSHCGATKQVTVYEGTSTGSTNANNFKDTEIELNDANITLDSGVIDKIGNKDVTLSADKVGASDLKGKVPDDKLAQVGDSPIYNFTINDGTENISKFGEDNWVTITLPYTLSEGEDVDSIAIWFIDDEGNLESIKATYNEGATPGEGYVTFKTNHFSYYTVTKLTPKERCELYGHNYTTTTVAGTCTSDGYELKVCVRCHDTVKKITSVAEGHKYTAVTTDATCTQNGKTVYTCVCGHSYTIRIAATGHNWELKEHVEASCTAAGYDKYGCDKCDGEYSEDYAQLDHKITDTVIAPTCTDYGYTEHKCDNCDYSYTDTIVPAKGHDYAASWSWADDYSTATLTLTCKADATHVVTQAAEITEIKTEPTCTAKGKIEYRATAVVNGEAYKDTKTAEIDKLDHTYAETFEYDANKHWHECKCGAKSEAVAHQFDEGTVNKAPTCSEAGEKTVKCECGYSKKVSVPATGEHNYVNGTCSVCGKVENVCDHTKLEYKIINFADYGCCGGSAVIRTCECGEVIEVDDMDSFTSIKCDLSDYEETEEEDEANGIYTETMSGKCPNCGLEVFAKATGIEKDCIEKYSIEYEFKKDGKVILHTLLEEEEEYHDDERVTVELKEYGCCGGTVSLYICEDCGKVTNYSGANYGCEAEEKTEEITDENGNVHEVTTYECAKCGLKSVIDVWEEKISECETVYHGICKITVGDKVIADVNISETDDDHDYDVEYEYFTEGGSCDDGYWVKYVCNVCGDTDETLRVGHRFWMHTQLPIDEAITCGGYIYGSECEVCGVVGNVSQMMPNCDMSNTEQSEITDENGVVHTIFKATCPDCGTKYEGDMWVEVRSVCESVTHMEYLVTDKDGNLIYDFDMNQHRNEHEYEYDYQLKGETCDDGYTVTESCPKCGESNTWNSSGHRTEREEIQLSDFGGCGGYIETYACQICDKVTSFYLNTRCPRYEGSVTEEIVGEDGLPHRITTSTCRNCSLTYIEESWQTPEVDCRYDSYRKLCIKKGDEVLFDAERKESYNSHDYEYEYQLEGETCDDGYKITETCKKCGYTDTWNSSGHRTSEPQYISLGDYNIHCGGELQFEVCDICGETTHFWENSWCKWEYAGTTDDGYEKEVCRNPECGAVRLYKSSKSERDENCTVIYSKEYKYFVGGECVFEIALDEREKEHNFDYTFKLQGESCEDGVNINYLCRDCGEQYGQYTQWHSLFDKETINLSEHGACGGTISVRECPCGERKEISVEHDGCQMEYVSEDKTDSGYSSVYKCATCGLTVTREMGTEKDGCKLNWYESLTVVIGDKAVYGPDKYVTSSEIVHDYEQTYKLLGETCKDGVIVTYTCKDCGESHDEEMYWCNTQTIAEYNFDEHGSCGGGYIRVYSCPCGNESGVDYYNGCAYNDMYESYVDDNGVNHEVYTSTCSGCGLKIVRDSYGEKNGCETIYYSTFTVTVGETTVVDGLKAKTGRGYNHKYESTFELKGETCEDGVTVYRTCTYCGISSSYEISYHESFLVEEYNFADHGACADKGYLRVYSCACGENYSVRYSRGCARYQSEETVVDDNGVEHYVATYYCEDCGLQAITDSYSVKDGCYRYEYRTYTITVGETVIVEGLECLYNTYDEHDYEHSFELKGKSCEDGVTVNSVCRVCGDTKSNEYTWHKEYTLNKIDLSDNGCCGAYVEVVGCPCGEYSRVNWNMSCDQQNTSYEDENGVMHLVYTYTCKTCGIVLTRDRYTVKEGCYEITYIVFNMTKGDEVLLDNVKTVDYRSEQHDYEYSFEMQGESCEDGYTVIYTCRACGESNSYYSSWHENFLLEIYELKEYGCCEGVIEVLGCACGQNRYLERRAYGCKFSETKENYTDDNGIEHTVRVQTCETCGLVITTDAYIVKENCDKITYHVYTVQVGDNLIIDAFETVYSRGEEHNYQQTVQMNGESCTDGVRVDYVCADCGYSYYDEYWDHWTYEKEYIDLSEHGACYGKIRVSECLCGEDKEIETSYCAYHYTNNEYVDEEGIRHYVEVATCDKCGLRVQRDRYTIRDPKSCTSVTYESIAISVGDKAVTVLESVEKQTDVHDYEYTATLADGAEQCGQGTIVTWTCRDCGYSNSNTYYHHYSVTLNKIDLSEHGAVCGGYAEERGCACGYEHSLSLDHSDCELETKYNTSVDVEDAVGYKYAYIYTCAVTDPACGFKIKYMSYYLKEEGNCVAHNYHTYLFGYNEETGEYKYEITIDTKSIDVLHTSETVEINEAYGDGTVKGTKTVCSVCGSYTETKYYYDSKDREVKYEVVSEALHEKADCVRSEEIREYTYYTNRDGKESYYTSRDYRYYKYSNGRIDWEENLYEKDYNYAASFGDYAVYTKTTHRSSSTYNGNYIEENAYTNYKGYNFTLFEYKVSYPDTDSESWYKNEYTYNFEGGCSRTRVYTSSDGTKTEETSEWHVDYKTNYEGGSCTQDRTRTCTCVICEQIISVETVSPRNHSWSIYHQETGMYECSRCGLQNANGASGAIVMEDMTAAYGADVNYIVGYWNRDEVKYTYYVSLVLKDVEADEVFVEVECTETEDIRAYSISKEAVAKAAEALGYTADQYDVKFTFVPEGADGNYDYAIVFTSETLENK